MRTLIALLLALFANAVNAQIIRAPGGAGGAGGAATIVSIFAEDTIRFTTFKYNDATPLDFAIQTTGSGTGVATASTFTGYGRFWRVRLNSAAAINSLAGRFQNSTAFSYYATVTNGFIAVLKFGVPVGYISGNTAWVGMFPGSVGGPGGATNLATIANGIYFGFLSPEATWRVCTHNSAAVRACTDTGISIATAGVAFEVMITASSGIVHMLVRRIDTIPATNVFDGVLGNLPGSTTPMRWAAFVQTGTASAVSIPIDFISGYATYPY